MLSVILELSALRNILIPGLVMLGAALLLGILIVIISHVCAVERNETREALVDALPGANCGGCGFPGCDAYAEYLLAPGADTSLCSVGGVECAREIASILGTAAVEPEEKVVILHCQGTRNQTGPRYDYLGTLSCHAANGLLAGPGSCTYGCLGFGDCIEVCAFDALRIQDGIVHVNRDNCTGCGQCVKVCPKNLLHLVPVKATLAVRCQNEWPGALTRKNCHIGCIGCGRCFKVCPSQAITLKGSLATVNQALCTHCDACIEVCPTKAIAHLL